MKTTKATALSMLKRYFEYSELKIALGKGKNPNGLTYPEIIGEMDSCTQNMRVMASKLNDYNLDGFVI